MTNVHRSVYLVFRLQSRLHCSVITEIRLFFKKEGRGQDYVSFGDYRERNGQPSLISVFSQTVSET